MTNYRGQNCVTGSVYVILMWLRYDILTRHHYKVFTNSPLQNYVEDEDDNEDNDTETDVSLFRLLRVNSSEWHYVFVACVCSLIIGGAQPLFAVLVAHFLRVMYLLLKYIYYTIINFQNSNIKRYCESKLNIVILFMTILVYNYLLHFYNDCDWLKV